MSNPQGGEANSSGMEPLWIGGLLLVAWFLINHFFGDQLLSLWMHSRLLVLNAIQALIPGEQENLAFLSYKIRAYAPQEWTSQDIAGVGSAVRWVLFPLYAAPLAWYGWKIYKSNPTASMKKVYSRQDLVESESKIWPWILPVKDLGLDTVPLMEGEWAMAQNPLEFMRANSLLDGGNTLNHSSAARLFSTQLGPLWEGISKLRDYERALLMAFLAAASGDRKDAFDGLERIARTVTSGKPDYSWVPAMVKKYGNGKIMKRLESRHAYVSTLMWTALLLAGKTGVMPSLVALWVKPVDRRLWYTLNCAGRNTPFSEVAGIRSHWLAERVAKRGIEYPQVQAAVVAMERALSEVKLVDEDDD